MMGEPVSIGKSTIQAAEGMGKEGGMGLGKVSEQDVAKFQSAMGSPTAVEGATQDIQTTSIGAQTMGDRMMQSMHSTTSVPGMNLGATAETPSELLTPGAGSVFSEAAHHMPTATTPPEEGGLGKAGMEVMQQQIDTVKDSEKKLVDLLNSSTKSPQDTIMIQYLTGQLAFLSETISRGVNKVVQTFQTLLKNQ